jgi:hypothetical protein
MSKSLIRKNQLHPDIIDLVSGYGADFFITPEALNIALESFNPTVSLTGENVVYTTGNQIVSGIKTFFERPLFNGSGLATTGELGVSTAFNGNRQITANVQGFQGLNPGGGDVVSFLNNVFYPFISATLTLNSFTIRDYGTNLSLTTFNSTLIPNSEPIGSITNMQYFRENVALTSPTTPQIGNYTSPPINLGGTFNTNITNLNIRVNVNDNGNPKAISGVRTLFFQPRYYYGLSSLENLSSSELTGNLTSSSPTFKPSNVTHSFAPNSQYIYFAYPNETKDGITKWGDNLTSIFDLNSNTENLGNFNSPQNLTVTYGNAKTMIFRVYRSTLLLTVGAGQSFNFRFTFGAS